MRWEVGCARQLACRTVNDVATSRQGRVRFFRAVSEDDPLSFGRNDISPPVRSSSSQPFAGPRRGVFPSSAPETSVPHARAARIDLADPHAAATEATAEPLFATPTRADRIGRIVAPVYLNGLGPFRLVVDTGASHSTLSPELTRKLGLDPAATERILLNGVTGSAEVPVVNLSIIRAGDLIIQNVRAPVVYSSIMAGAEGILGVAGLRRERIYVDFEHDRVEITRAGSGPNRKPGPNRNSRLDLSGFFRVPGQFIPAACSRWMRASAASPLAQSSTRAPSTLSVTAHFRRRYVVVRRCAVLGRLRCTALRSQSRRSDLEVAPPMVLGPLKISEVARGVRRTSASSRCGASKSVPPCCSAWTCSAPPARW